MRYSLYLKKEKPVKSGLLRALLTDLMFHNESRPEGESERKNEFAPA